MRLTVIVPVYNGEKTIEKCILSLVNQDYEDMEILVVNDGSNDKTIDIVKELSVNNSSKSIRLINKNNQGLTQARKTGIRNALGEYIGFVDSDDWVEPDMFSSMMEKIDDYGYDIVCCEMSYDYLNKSDIHHIKLDEGYIYSEKEIMSAINNRRGVMASMCNKVIKRSLFDDIFFLKGNFCGEDYSITVQILKNKCKVGVIKQPFYHYNQNDGSMVVGGYGRTHELGYQVYKRILYQVHKKYSINISREYDNYMINEFMGFILAMGYNRKYDYDKIKWIQSFIRKRILFVLYNKNNSLLCKGTSFVMCFSYKLVILVFNIYRKKFVKFN